MTSIIKLTFDRQMGCFTSKKDKYVFGASDDIGRLHIFVIILCFVTGRRVVIISRGWSSCESTGCTPVGPLFYI